MENWGVSLRRAYARTHRPLYTIFIDCTSGFGAKRGQICAKSRENRPFYIWRCVLPLGVLYYIRNASPKGSAKGAMDVGSVRRLVAL